MIIIISIKIKIFMKQILLSLVLISMSFLFTSAQEEITKDDEISRRGPIVIDEPCEGGMVRYYFDGDGDGYLDISNCIELQSIENNLSADYELVNNIDCSDSVNWNSGAGFSSIGLVNDEFWGVLEGHSFDILDLYNTNLGMFGVLGGEVHNLNLVNVTVAPPSTEPVKPPFFVPNNILSNKVDGRAAQF